MDSVTAAYAEVDHPLLTAEQLEELEAALIAKREVLLGRRQVPVSDGERPADELDLASGESDLAFEHRLLARDRGLLAKVTKALARMDIGEYDECEDCADPIGYPRLRARPEASLCIACKEEQEVQERGYIKRRNRDDDSMFRF